MLEHILQYERTAFFLLNGSDYPFLDRFFWLVSSKTAWIPMYAFILFILAYRKPWREYLLIFVAIAITITLCDQFASHLCKNYFARPRPTHHPDFMNEVKTVLGYRGGKYGFMSSHAANAFGYAVFTAALLRNKAYTAVVLTWAALTAYSRIYLGVHFISDVIAGGASGAAIGYIIYLSYAKARAIRPSAPPETIYTVKEKQALACAISITILTLLLLNKPLAKLLT